MPELSIIVPIWNGQKYLRELIKSVIDSDFDDFELLLVDDGSTDNSSVICSEYTKRDNRILYFKKENGGIADARNYGLIRATGKYVYFMDQDDFIEPEGFRTLYNILEQSDCDFCSTNSYEYDGKNRTERIFIKEKGKYDRASCRDICKNLIGYNRIKLTNKSLSDITMSGAVWLCMFKRKFLIENKLQFEKFVDYEDDLVFLINCLIKANQVYLLNQSFYTWRYGHASESRRVKYIKNFFEKRCNYRKYLSDVLEEICDLEDDYKFFLNEFDGYTLWKACENETILCDIRNFLKQKEFFNTVKKTICAKNSIDNIISVYHGYKKAVLSLIKREHYLLVYLILKIKLIYVHIARRV